MKNIQHLNHFKYNKRIEMEQNSVNQRLNLLVETFENGVKAAFARKAGISTQGAQELLAGRKGAPSFKVLVKILESYPTVDANWLVLGRGAMLLNEAVELIDTEGITITPAEAKQLLKLQEDNATKHEQTGAELERVESELQTVRKTLSAFVDAMMPPAKAKQLKAQFPESFPPSEE